MSGSGAGNPAEVTRGRLDGCPTQDPGAHAGDVTTAHFSAGRVLGGHQASVGYDLFGRRKAADVSKLGDADSCDEWSHTGDRLEESECRVGQQVVLDLSVGVGDEFAEGIDGRQLLLKDVTIKLVQREFCQPAATSTSKEIANCPLVASSK